jgi:histidinol-phosphate phosphatase family protein
MRPQFDKNWSLFLDRDGVINQRPGNDYVRKWSDFQFMPGVLPAIKKLSEVFGKIFIVTNQQGIGKGFYTELILQTIHQNMLQEIERAGGRVNAIYFSPHLVSENALCRKPAPGMAYSAKKDFPDVDFSKSVMVGDTASDMEFAANLGMYKIFIDNEDPQHPNFNDITRPHEISRSLHNWTKTFK